MPKTERTRSTRPSRAASTRSAAADPSSLPPCLRAGRTATLPILRSEFPVAARPDTYGMVIEGTCLAPEVNEGDVALVSPSAPLRAGGLVALHPHEGGPLLKRLVVAPPPFILSPGTNVRGLVIVEQINPPRTYYVPTSRLQSVHAVVGIVPRERYRAGRKPVPAVAAGGPVPGTVARRGLLGGVAALVLPTAAGAARRGDGLPAAGQNSLAHPDAELIALCAEFDALERRYHDSFKDVVDREDELRRQPMQDAMQAAQEPMLDRMAELRATTPEGWQARARTLALYAPDRAVHDPDDYTDGRLLAVLLRDMAGDTHPASAVPVPTAGPDDRLIFLCWEHAQNLRAYNTCEGKEEDRLWTHYQRTRDAIAEAKPQTMAGMLAKARAAKAEALNPDGSEVPEGCPAADWAWDLVGDLLRLAGRTVA